MATPKQKLKRFVEKDDVTKKDKFKIGDVAYLVDYQLIDPDKLSGSNYQLHKKAKNYGFTHGTKVKITKILESRNTKTQGNTYQVIRHDNTSTSPRTYAFRSVMLWKESDYKKLKAKYVHTYNPETNEFCFKTKKSVESVQMRSDSDSNTETSLNKSESDYLRSTMQYVCSVLENLSLYVRSVSNNKKFD
jgi:hypothetical protein